MIPFLLAGAGGLGLLGGGLAAFSGATARKIEKAVPRDGELIEVDGQTIHYTDSGSGPAIVMIHGLGGQLRNFARPMVDDLARDYRVIRVDRPGSGYSPRAAGTSARLRVQAETIAELIRILKLDRPLIVGHSLGGALALSLALNHPEVVGGLALDRSAHPGAGHQGRAAGLQGRSSSARPRCARRSPGRSPRRSGWRRPRSRSGKCSRPSRCRPISAPKAAACWRCGPNNFYASSSDLVDLEGELEGMVERYPTLSVPVSILYARADNLLDSGSTASGRRARYRAPRSSWSRAGTCSPSPSPSSPPPSSAAPPPAGGPDARRAAG